MTRLIVWRPAAQADLLNLYDWIAGHAGRDTALEYTSGIEIKAASLAEFSERGALREDLTPLMRTVVYRRRTLIAYRVLEHAVEIVRLAHKGRELGRLFVEED